MSACKFCGDELSTLSVPSEAVHLLKCEVEQLRALRNRMVAWGKEWDAITYKAYDDEHGFDAERDALIDARDAIIARAQELAD